MKEPTILGHNSLPLALVGIGPLLAWPLLRLVTLIFSWLAAFPALAAFNPSGWDGEKISAGFLFSTAAIFAILLVIGSQRGWPDWTFSYGGILVVLSILLTNSSMPQIGLERLFPRNELWGWRAWIPELLVITLAVALSRSLRPLFQLFRAIWQDWTRLSFALYSLLPLSLLIIFDETRGLTLEISIDCLELVLAAGALGYLLSRSRHWRFLWLFVPFWFAWAAAGIISAVYWHGRQETWMQLPANGWSVLHDIYAAGGMILVALCLPGLVFGVLRLAARIHPPRIHPLLLR